MKINDFIFMAILLMTAITFFALKERLTKTLLGDALFAFAVLGLAVPTFWLSSNAGGKVICLGYSIEALGLLMGVALCVVRSCLSKMAALTRRAVVSWGKRQ